ncbi:MAG: BREX-1 system adenine-specific DNA-methyltransferase PglX [Dissulfuribacterales bacterium]
MKQNANNPVPNFFLASAADFKKIPGSPIAYWVSNNIRTLYKNKQIKKYLSSEGQILTGNNEKFLRYIWEVSSKTISENNNWKLHHKGGDFRKWYGNVNWVVDWRKETREFYRRDKTARIPKAEFWTLFGITWSTISSSKISFRKVHKEESYNKASPTLSSSDETLINFLLIYLNSKIPSNILEATNPTLNYLVMDIENLPVNMALMSDGSTINQAIKCLDISKSDWDSYETSWDFTTLPLLQSDHHQPTMKATYDKVRTHWRNMTLEMQRLEEENNRIFIEAYGLQDELTPDVPLSEITLTCNPHYRYKGDKSEEELETLLLTDTVRELISYSIGCMMGRYRLDVPGLIYAHSGNKDFEEIYHRKNNIHRKDAKDAKNKKDGASRNCEAENSPLRSLRLCGDNSSTGENLFQRNHKTDAQSATTIQHSAFNIQHSFSPDDDGIIPIMDTDWFPDDATSRFIEFIKIAWPSETLDENVKFIAGTLKPKSNEAPINTIRRYLSTTFFKDHLKTYKKRPVYWLFSSGKQKAFECLVYLHRYNKTTLSRMRSAYVTPLQGNIRARIEFLKSEKDAATSASDQRKYQKEIDALKKKQIELSKFDDELRHYADMKISLDLDDGVKVNYGKFGNLLAETKAITGKK